MIIDTKYHTEVVLDRNLRVVKQVLTKVDDKKKRKSDIREAYRLHNNKSFGSNVRDPSTEDLDEILKRSTSFSKFYRNLDIQKFMSKIKLLL
jgi:hypothetical protein